MNDFFSEHRHKIFVGICFFSVVYLLVHFFGFEEFKYTGLMDLIQESREHVFHIVPIMIAFMIYFILAWQDYKKNSNVRR